MSRHYDRHGMFVIQGRHISRPFGRIGEWPEHRQDDLGRMRAAESAANQGRAAYRETERRQPCGGCGALPGFPQNLGCATPWG